MSEANLPPIDAERRARLLRGEAVVWTEPAPGKNTPRLVAIAVLDAPAERVWRLIDDVPSYKTTMPRTADSRELYRRGNEVGTRVTVEMPFPLPNLTSETKAIHTVVPGELYKREWTLVAGDYRENSGSWTLVPFDGDPKRTLVVYSIVVEPKIPIPARIRNAVQAKAMPGLMDRLRSLVR